MAPKMLEYRRESIALMPILRRSAAVALFLTASACGGQGEHEVHPVSLSAGGMHKLFDDECLRWRSFDWAKAKYLAERKDCEWGGGHGEITDCQANVTGIDWTVPVFGETDAPKALAVSYFFDETAEPIVENAVCEITLPRQYAAVAEDAAKLSAASYQLRGPYASGDNGFSKPTLSHYWTDAVGQPIIGIFEENGGGKKLYRFHGKISSRR